MDTEREESHGGRLSLAEERRDFDRQREQLQDIDDKAMRSVRTGVVVLGFVVTAIGLTSRLDTVSVRPLPALSTTVGTFLLAATIVLGVGTYTVTEYSGRLTATQRARLDQETTQRESEHVQLVRIYRRWNTLNRREIELNSAYLGATLSTLTGGILVLLIAGLQVVVPAVLPACTTLTRWNCVGRLWIELAVMVPVILLPLSTKLIVYNLNRSVDR